MKYKFIDELHFDVIQGHIMRAGFADLVTRFLIVSVFIQHHLLCQLVLLEIWQKILTVYMGISAQWYTLETATPATPEFFFHPCS